MASAYQCDRCKKYYTKEKKGIPISPIHILCVEKRSERYCYLDLCSNCLDSLDNWFSKGQPEKEQDHDDP